MKKKNENIEEDSLELLLKRKYDRIEPHREEKKQTKEFDLEEFRTPYLKADGNASLEDFIAMVKNIVVKAMKKDNVEFLSDEGSTKLLEPSYEIDHPVIFYSVILREPRKTEPKPKIREDGVERNADGSIARRLTVYGQVFDCIVQFNIAASDYHIANKVMNVFEDAMFKYTGHFKKNGVNDIFFLKQYTDQNLDQYRQKMSVRSLVYRISIEKIHVVYDTTIAKIRQNQQIEQTEV